MSQVPSPQLHSGFSRRELLRLFVVGNALSTSIGKPWITSLLADCQPVQAGAGILRVKLSDYPNLQTDGGGIRLSLNPFTATSTSVTPFYPILVNRVSEGNFVALSSRCTHQGCVVNAYDESNGGCACFCHGSIFAIDGKRIGGPANSALTKYRLSFDGSDQLCIEIPSLGFSVTPSKVDAAVGSRVRLQFPGKRNLSYEIRYRASIQDEEVVVPFSKTAEGPAEETVLSPTNNSTVSAYVDARESGGFFSVWIQVTEE